MKITGAPYSAVSRRSLLKTAAALSVCSSGLVRAQTDESAASRSRLLAYVGAYTGAVGNGGNGEGISLFAMNPANGVLSALKTAAEVPSPSWLALDPSGTHLYAANEVSDFNGNSGSISAFAVNRSNGDLTLLNTVSSEGARPAHLSLDRSGRFVLAANYGGGTIAVFPIQPNGSLGSAVDVHEDTGSVGPMRATSAPVGSFAISGHQAPHAHFIQTDPSDRFVLQTDLGQDRIYIYQFNAQTGKLTPAGGEPFVSLPHGAGPRHLAFHPNGPWVYSIQEEGSTLVSYRFDASAGSLLPQQTVTTVPERFAGTTACSELVISRDGSFLYAANRAHNSIGAFSIDETGGLTHIGDSPALGDFPRHINIDPTGRFLYCCNELSDNVTCFRIDRATGLLRSTGQYTPVGSPAVILFLD